MTTTGVRPKDKFKLVTQTMKKKERDQKITYVRENIKFSPIEITSGRGISLLQTRTFHFDKY